MTLATLKKNFFIFLIIILILVLVIAILIKARKRPQTPTSPVSEKKVAEEKFDLSTWEDPAGFSFDYPEILKIDTHEEDEINYAHLELTQEGKMGRVLIIANDSDYDTLEDWLAEDKEVIGLSSLDTEIASLPAKKVALKEGKEIASFIDLDQVIYTIIKEPQGEDFWRQTYRTILDSFKFIPLEGESEADFQNWLEGFETSNVDVVEPLEIIE